MYLFHSLRFGSGGPILVKTKMFFDKIGFDLNSLSPFLNNFILVRYH